MFAIQDGTPFNGSMGAVMGMMLFFGIASIIFECDHLRTVWYKMQTVKNPRLIAGKDSSSERGNKWALRRAACVI